MKLLDFPNDLSATVTGDMVKTNYCIVNIFDFFYTLERLNNNHLEH